MQVAIVLLSFLVDTSSGFSSYNYFPLTRVCNYPSSVLGASGSESDDYDDWFDDFDPSQFEAYNQDDGFLSQDAQHDYSRDTAADNSNVDLAEVNHLIAERQFMRKTRRFQEADAIRDELLDKHGVMIRDRERLWRSGCSASGSGSRWTSDKRNEFGRKKQSDFGPNGHDYNLAVDAGPNQSSFSEQQIHDLLANRLESKLNRDYRAADRIQEELLNGGVVINDKRREWRADGALFEEFSSRKYVQSSYSASSADTEHIQAMVDERSKAKSERLYGRADEIRDVLFRDFSVTIDDKRREWSIGGSFGSTRNQDRKKFERFQKTPGSSATDDDGRIQELLDERDVARANRDFEEADSIREELLAMNVFIDDHRRQWSIGTTTKQSDAYEQRGGGLLADHEVDEITQLLSKRLEHKRNRKFKSADKIRDQLRDAFNIQIDDRNREWHLVSNEYTMCSSSPAVDEETKEAIGELVEKRAVAKQQKDYSTADSIRDLLMERYMVSIDDRVREWKQLDSSGEGDNQDETRVEHATEVVVTKGTTESGGSNDIDVATLNPEAVKTSRESLEELQQLTIPYLKERLRSMNLPVSGKKAELIQRLLDN